MERVPFLSSKSRRYKDMDKLDTYKKMYIYIYKQLSNKLQLIRCAFYTICQKKTSLSVRNPDFLEALFNTRKSFIPCFWGKEAGLKSFQRARGVCCIFQGRVEKPVS
jgi:hypothetical protein